MEPTRREEILDAFIKISTRKGLDNTTMQNIAKEVGISVGTIYLYFKNKEELIDAFMKRLFMEFDLFIKRVVNQDATAEKRLHDLLVGDVEFASKHIRENQSLFDFFHNDVIKHIRKTLKENRTKFETERIATVETIIRQGIEEGDFEVEDPAEAAKMFFLAFGSEHFRGPLILERPHEEVVADAEAMFAILLKSIKKR